MLKKILIISMVSMVSINNYSQETKKEVESIKTKIDAFTSKTGSLIKFIDKKLPNLKASYSVSETRIRKISSGNLSAYFYQIVKEGKYGSSTASIEYSDLIEVTKALKVLKNELDNDILSNPDYLENKFSTVDGFQVGYYISNGKANWFLKLEKSGSDSTLFIDNGNTIESVFTEAKSKIDELKK